MNAKAAPMQEPRSPAHVAIIMDGNGRWAKARGLPRVAGHKKGAEALRGLLEACHGLGVKYLTIYAFSSENWNRPQSEVSDLMQLLRYYLQHELKNLIKNSIRLKIIGDTSLLDQETQRQITEGEAATEKGEAFQLIIALSYGARSEMVKAVRDIAKEIAAGRLDPEKVDESVINRHLYTQGIPDPDLLIRTGGEQRLSNFLLWQQAYTELFFTPVFWPDFSVEHFREAIAEYAKRERRYGNTPA